MTYVAEHAPHGKRGLYTGWIQTTATLGLFLALVVIGVLRHFMDAAQFAAWGWRVPSPSSHSYSSSFLVYIRLKLKEESPVFAEAKAQWEGLEGAPSRIASARWSNAKIKSCLRCSVPRRARGVVWYAGQFYSLYFLTTTLGVDYGHGLQADRGRRWSWAPSC